MARSSQVCPRCWTPYRPEAKRCPRCGFDLQQDSAVSFIDLFGPPEVLRRYEIQETLAHSRVGHIYRTLDLETGALCVIKELSGAALVDPLEAELAAARLKRRVRRLSQLSHPNLVCIRDLLSEGSRHFVVMDLVEGPSLKQLLERRDEPIPEPVVLQWASQLCDALSHLHDQDPPLFFPDLSPQHVILLSESRPVLIDLGLTRLFEARRSRADSASDDVAALGILLYQTLAPGAKSSASGRRPSLDQVNPTVSASTAEAIMRAIGRRAAEGYSSAAEFRQALLGEHPSPSRSMVLDSAAGVIPIVEPYELTAQHRVRTLEELVIAVLEGGSEAWHIGVQEFFEGSITHWVRTAAEALRQSGQDARAQTMSEMAQRGEELRRQAQGDSDVQRQTALFRWLTQTGYAWGQPRLAVSTTFLRLGAVRGELRLGAIVKVENSGTGFLAGEIKSHAEWLVVRPTEFGCRPGESSEIIVELRDRSVFSQPASSVQALQISSNGGEAWVGASVSAPRPVLSLDRDASILRTTIDFGEVQAGQPSHASAVVRNEGGGVLTGRISTSLPWLRVRPTHFTCAAGASVPVDVELLPDFLSHGVTVQGNALVVDSDYGQGRIEVRADKVQPLLQLSIDTLDFGTVAPTSRISQTLRLVNSGTGLLKGLVSSQVSWMTVEKPDFECLAGETCVITIWANPVGLAGGDVEEAQALVIDTNGGYRSLAVHLAIRRPRLDVDQHPLDFGVLLPGQKASVTLTVSNRGMAPLHAELVPQLEWLSVDPAGVVCGNGEETEVELILSAPLDAEGETLRFDRALYIASNGGVATLGLRAEIVKPRLVVDPLHLDFGLIGPAEVARGQLRLRNAGSGMMEWHLAGDSTWLEVFPRQGTCGPGQTATIEVNGFALALPEGTTSAQSPLHIESNGGHAEVPISVAIAAPALAVLPLLLDLGTSRNYAPVEGTVRIANRGGGHLRGEITADVDWLRVSPPVFECATGSVVEATVTADPQPLSEGETFASDALSVTSNGGQDTVDVRLSVELEPILEVNPESLVLSLSGLDKQDETAGEPPPVELVLANRGYGGLRVRFQPTAAWLLTDRGSATLRHGRRARVKVGLDLAAWRLEEKPTEGRLDIRAGEETLISIPVTVTIDADPISRTGDKG